MSKRCRMQIKNHIVRSENFKTILMLHDAKLDHSVIAAFLCSEGIQVTTIEVTAMLKHYHSLGQQKINQGKAKALLKAKMDHFADSELPCPLTY